MGPVGSMLSIMWWIAWWGLAELMMASWKRHQKFMAYVFALLVVTGFIIWKPELIASL